MAHPDLLHHNETQFAKAIIKLCPGVWTAVGYAASTQHMIEGTSSVTIIDTSESTKAAENVLAEFRKLRLGATGCLGCVEISSGSRSLLRSIS